MTEENTSAVMAAFADLITRDVPGSLLVLSLVVNAVLLAPYVVRSWRKSYYDDQ